MDTAEFNDLINQLANGLSSIAKDSSVSQEILDTVRNLKGIVDTLRTAGPGGESSRH